MASVIVPNMTNSFAVCEKFGRMSSGGLLLGGSGDLAASNLPLLLLQICLVNCLTLIFRIFLNPFVQFSFVPEIMSGIAIGPSCLSRIDKFKEKIFMPQRGNLMINAFENLGLIFAFYLLAVQVDFKVLWRPRKIGVATGISIIVIPMAITSLTALFVKDFLPNNDLQQSLFTIAFLQSATSFRQIVILLEDLKLLNSELGRTAATSAILGGTGSIFGAILVIKYAKFTPGLATKPFMPYVQLSQFLMVVVICFIFRPILLWMMRQTPERACLKETHLYIIIAMILSCSLFGEITGQHPFVGPLILGLATPNSPPMGSSLVHKFESFVWIVFMPAYAINVGKRVDLFKVGLDNFTTVNFIAIVATLAKVVSTVIPAIYYKMTLKDAFSLGLILSCRGIFDVILFYRAKQGRLISDAAFSTMVMTSVFHSTIIVPIFRAVYDTSRKYMAYNRRTIQHMKENSELQMVACIHDLDDVTLITNAIDIFHPKEQSPFVVSALNLEELDGSFFPLFISHKYHTAPSAKPTRASSVISLFHQLEQQKQGLVQVQCYTSVAPLTTMHEDICSLANDKSSTLVILPFQKTDKLHIRAVNKNVLDKAPCSVAIFFGRGIITEPVFRHSKFTIEACVVFVGGPDDREALALGARMVENPLTRLTVVRFVDVKWETSDMTERSRDVTMIKDFRANAYESRKPVTYKEEKLVEVSDTARALQCLESDFDLMLVGRRHDDESKLLKGLSEWIEIEELGVIGDAFVSSEISRASVLVVQQQALVVEQMLDSPKLQQQQWRASIPHPS